MNCFKIHDNIDIISILQKALYSIIAARACNKRTFNSSTVNHKKQCIIAYYYNIIPPKSNKCSYNYVEIRAFLMLKVITNRYITIIFV